MFISFFCVMCTACLDIPQLKGCVVSKIKTFKIRKQVLANRHGSGWDCFYKGDPTGIYTVCHLIHLQVLLLKKLTGSLYREILHEKSLIISPGKTKVEIIVCLVSQP